MGLPWALDYGYQVFRHATVEYMADRLSSLGVGMVPPVGRHAVFLEPRAMLPEMLDRSACHFEPIAS